MKAQLATGFVPYQINDFVKLKDKSSILNSMLSRIEFKKTVKIIFE